MGPLTTPVKLRWNQLYILSKMTWDQLSSLAKIDGINFPPLSKMAWDQMSVGSIVLHSLCTNTLTREFMVNMCQIRVFKL